MHLKIYIFILGAAVLIEGSGHVSWNPDHQKADTDPKRLKTRGLERRKRAPNPDTVSETSGWQLGIILGFRQILQDVLGVYAEPFDFDDFENSILSRGQTAEIPAGSCILPEQPNGGSFEQTSCARSCNVKPGDRVPTGTILTCSCNEGYILRGANASFCSNGSWYISPICVKICQALESKSLEIFCRRRGEIVSCQSEVLPETTAYLACKHSYKIPLAEDFGYREIRCLEDGSWDRPLFRCLPECGTSLARGRPFIVNGVPAERGVTPWHVAIYERQSNGSHEQICGGTLLSPDLVVSAAHCFYDDTVGQINNANRYVVAAGKYNRLYNWPEIGIQKSAVKRIEVTSRYLGMAGNYADDIALLRMQIPFNLTTLIRPICMDWDNLYEREHLQEGKLGKVVGWGKTAEGVPSVELQEINLPYVPFSNCSSAVPADFKGYLTRDKFCAGYLNGTSLCDGDSGGGLTFQIGELWYLRGVVSVGPVNRGQCDNRYYTAFTNIGEFKDWVRNAYNQEV